MNKTREYEIKQLVGFCKQMEHAIAAMPIYRWPQNCGD
jgi:hypothetical protein